MTSVLPLSTLLTGNISPFVQRVWIALEAKGLQYQYVEVDPYKKPQALLDVNPRGLVPGIRHGDWGCGESSVLMEYVSTRHYGYGEYTDALYSWKISIQDLLCFPLALSIEQLLGCGAIT